MDKITEFFKANADSFLQVIATSVILAIFAFGIHYISSDYMKTKAKVALLEAQFDNAHMETIVAPNLKCENCGGHIYQGHYNEYGNLTSYVCCTCGVYRVNIWAPGTILRPTMLTVFKQDYKNFKAESGLDYIDNHAIERHSYNSRGVHFDKEKLREK